MEVIVQALSHRTTASFPPSRQIDTLVTRRKVGEDDIRSTFAKQASRKPEASDGICLVMQWPFNFKSTFTTRPVISLMFCSCRLRPSFSRISSYGAHDPNMDNNSIYKFVPQDIVVPPTDWIVERYQRERENNLKHLDKMAALANEIEAMKLDLSYDNPAVAMLGDFVDTIRVAQCYACILPPWPHDAAIPRVIPTVADALHQVPQLENGQSNANVVESNFRMAGESLMRIKAETDRLVARVAALEPHMRALHAVMKDKEDRELAKKVGEGLAGISYARDEDMESLQAEDGSVTDGQDGGEASSAAKVKVLVEGLETMDLEEISEKKKVEGDMEWEDEKEKMV